MDGLIQPGDTLRMERAGALLAVEKRIGEGRSSRDKAWMPLPRRTNNMNEASTPYPPRATLTSPAALPAQVRGGDEFQDASRRQVLLVDPHAER